MRLRLRVVGFAVAAALSSPAIVTAIEPVASGAGLPSRQSRFSYIATAGGDIYLWSSHRSLGSGGGCTLAFSAWSPTTKQSGSLTAGHCVGTLPGGPAYTVAQTRSGKGDTTDPGDRLGAVNAGDYRLGTAGDSAFMTLASDRSVTASVFTGGVASGTTIPVVGLARLADGIHVCYSGAASGEHCGFTVVGSGQTITFPDRGHHYRIHDEWRATRRACPSRAGDSGSPVYVKRHGRAYAVGILSGGQKRSGQCPFFFTPVRLALAQLHLRLFTAPVS